MAKGSLRRELGARSLRLLSVVEEGELEDDSGHHATTSLPKVPYEELSNNSFSLELVFEKGDVGDDHEDDGETSIMSLSMPSLSSINNMDDSSFQSSCGGLVLETPPKTTKSKLLPIIRGTNPGMQSAGETLECLNPVMIWQMSYKQKMRWEAEKGEQSSDEEETDEKSNNKSGGNSSSSSINGPPAAPPRNGGLTTQLSKDRIPSAPRRQHSERHLDC